MANHAKTLVVADGSVAAMAISMLDDGSVTISVSSAVGFANCGVISLKAETLAKVEHWLTHAPDDGKTTEIKDS